MHSVLFMHERISTIEPREGRLRLVCRVKVAFSVREKGLIVLRNGGSITRGSVQVGSGLLVRVGS